MVFEYQAIRDGRRVHVSHVDLKGRTWGYNVEFIAPAGDWDASRTLARQFEQAFQPLGWTSPVGHPQPTCPSCRTRRRQEERPSSRSLLGNGVEAL